VEIAAAVVAWRDPGLIQILTYVMDFRLAFRRAIGFKSTSYTFRTGDLSARVQVQPFVP